MKKLLILFTFLFSLISIITLTEKSAFNKNNSDSDSIEAMKKIYTDALNEQIKGKEEWPADSVFKDMQMMKKVPAGRLITIMNKGFSKSLGVSCEHCHNTNDWASNEKKEKGIAREMMKMSGQIREMISNIKEIEPKETSVTCYTCHRGEVVPITRSKE